MVRVTKVRHRSAAARVRDGLSWLLRYGKWPLLAGAVFGVALAVASLSMLLRVPAAYPVVVRNSTRFDDGHADGDLAAVDVPRA